MAFCTQIVRLLWLDSNKIIKILKNQCNNKDMLSEIGNIEDCCVVIEVILNSLLTTAIHCKPVNLHCQSLPLCLPHTRRQCFPSLWWCKVAFNELIEIFMCLVLCDFFRTVHHISTTVLILSILNYLQIFPVLELSHSNVAW